MVAAYMLPVKYRLALHCEPEADLIQKYDMIVSNP